MRDVNDWQPGTWVQTPLGKGIVREALNGGRVRVDIGPRAVVVRASDVLPLGAGPRSRPTHTGQLTPQASTPGALSAREIDLHGLTVDEAIARIDEILNDALLAGVAELRIIHGRSGGKIRGALHRRLREIGAVASFRLDPRNTGVTIVKL